MLSELLHTRLELRLEFELHLELRNGSKALRAVNSQSIVAAIGGPGELHLELGTALGVQAALGAAQLKLNT
jgi:hypothetical protein